MSNFQCSPSSLEYSTKVSNKRLEKATALIGEKMVKRIIALALFFLGANRNKVCEMLNLPLGTFLTFLNRFDSCGTSAFSQKRPTVKAVEAAQQAELIYEHNAVQSKLHLSDKTLKLPVSSSNSLQHKVLILSFFNWGLISCSEAAMQLGFSERHIRDLGQNLEANDVESLIDKRQGQQQDYNFTTEVKAELIQQFAFNVVTGKSTSSKHLCQQVNDVCNTQVSDRSIRLYMNKLGLSGIKKSLFEMLEDFKKNSPN